MHRYFNHCRDIPEDNQCFLPTVKGIFVIPCDARCFTGFNHCLPHRNHSNFFYQYLWCHNQFTCSSFGSRTMPDNSTRCAHVIRGSLYAVCRWWEQSYDLLVESLQHYEGTNTTQASTHCILVQISRIFASDFATVTHQASWQHVKYSTIDGG